MMLEKMVYSTRELEFNKNERVRAIDKVNNELLAKSEGNVYPKQTRIASRSTCLSGGI